MPSSRKKKTSTAHRPAVNKMKMKPVSQEPSDPGQSTTNDASGPPANLQHKTRNIAEPPLQTRGSLCRQGATAAASTTATTVGTMQQEPPVAPGTTSGGDIPQRITKRGVNGTQPPTEYESITPAHQQEVFQSGFAARNGAASSGEGAVSAQEMSDEATSAIETTIHPSGELPTDPTGLPSLPVVLVSTAPRATPDIPGRLSTQATVSTPSHAPNVTTSTPALITSSAPSATHAPARPSDSATQPTQTGTEHVSSQGTSDAGGTRAESLVRALEDEDDDDDDEWGDIFNMDEYNSGDENEDDGRGGVMGMSKQPIRPTPRIPK
ncbi:hypothetical protein NLI96_g12170 [Meripilus lineatus]|uniref:Uncharacterized protein n=1 Tax=Meripilus lineatus TaxID=2056292 RepID=A0AAD5URT8_9APHY|nr:hypothetical protein NLI96_g12170 [Physisporinus lineatus]